MFNLIPPFTCEFPLVSVSTPKMYGQHLQQIGKQKWNKKKRKK